MEELVQKPDVPRTDLRAIGKPIVVLVVEQEETIRDLLALGLKDKGFTVKLACNGKEAIESFRATPGEIDVVLLDWGMDGMNGRETLEVIRELDANARCCFMSGGAGVLGTAETPVLAKPFDMASVIRVLQSMAR